MIDCDNNSVSVSDLRQGSGFSGYPANKTDHHDISGVKNHKLTIYQLTNQQPIIII